MKYLGMLACQGTDARLALSSLYAREALAQLSCNSA